VEPEFPFAYTKYSTQTEETKGRTNPDWQDDRHECETKGVESKCHICEDFKWYVRELCSAPVGGGRWAMPFRYPREGSTQLMLPLLPRPLPPLTPLRSPSVDRTSIRTAREFPLSTLALHPPPFSSSPWS
jgi:hypothetical protein